MQLSFYYEKGEEIMMKLTQEERRKIYEEERFASYCYNAGSHLEDMIDRTSAEEIEHINSIIVSYFGDESIHAAASPEGNANLHSNLCRSIVASYINNHDCNAAENDAFDSIIEGIFQTPANEENLSRYLTALKCIEPHIVEYLDSIK